MINTLETIDEIYSNEEFPRLVEQIFEIHSVFPTNPQVWNLFTLAFEDILLSAALRQADFIIEPRHKKVDKLFPRVFRVLAGDDSVGSGFQLATRDYLKDLSDLEGQAIWGNTTTVFIFVSPQNLESVAGLVRQSIDDVPIFVQVNRRAKRRHRRGVGVPIDCLALVMLVELFSSMVVNQPSDRLVQEPVHLPHFVVRVKCFDQFFYVNAQPEANFSCQPPHVFESGLKLRKVLRGPKVVRIGTDHFLSVFNVPDGLPFVLYRVAVPGRGHIFDSLERIFFESADADSVVNFGPFILFLDLRRELVDLFSEREELIPVLHVVGDVVDQQDSVTALPERSLDLFGQVQVRIQESLIIQNYGMEPLQLGLFLCIHKFLSFD